MSKKRGCGPSSTSGTAPMNEALVAAGATIVTAIITAVITWRRDKGKDEVEQSTAETTSGQLALEIAKELRARLSEMEDRHERERAEDKAERDRIAASNRLWRVFYGDLSARWTVHRLADAPPPPPTQYDDAA